MASRGQLIVEWSPQYHLGKYPIFPFNHRLLDFCANVITHELIISGQQTIDRKAGICAIWAFHMKPWGDPICVELGTKFDKAVFRMLKQ